nr:polyA polymerase [Bacillus subtilis subsp. subtilis str. 168]
MEKVFIKALPVLRILIEAGHQAYFVGGAVRDSYMKRTIGDVDIATDAAPDQVERLFQRTVDVGKDESDYVDFRRPSEVQFISSLEEDLKRRDLTINAMAMTADGKVLDYFGGKKDIDQKVIRTVGKPEDRFQEDALRMLRAVRFMSQLGFTLSPETEEAIAKEKSLLSHVSVERKTIEFEKLLQGRASRQALQTLIQTRLYEELPGFYHKRENLISTSEFPFFSLTSREELWAALLINLGIVLKDAPLFLKAWKLPGKVIKEAIHIADTFGQSLDAMTMYRAGKKALLSAAKISQLRQNEKLDEKKLKDIQYAYQNLPIKSLKDLDITGKDLLALRNRPAGKWVSEELQWIEQAVVTGKLSNQKKHIEEWLKTCGQH